MLPDHWWQKPLYRLSKSIACAGHIIPKGFISDGATSPRTLWPIFPPIGKYLKATLVHDYLLKQGNTRRYSDAEFKKALQELGLVKWRLNTLYFAVRAYSIYKLFFTKNGTK